MNLYMIEKLFVHESAWKNFQKWKCINHTTILRHSLDKKNQQTNWEQHWSEKILIIVTIGFLKVRGFSPSYKIVHSRAKASRLIMDLHHL